MWRKRASNGELEKKRDGNWAKKKGMKNEKNKNKNKERKMRRYATTTRAKKRASLPECGWKRENEKSEKMKKMKKKKEKKIEMPKKALFAVRNKERQNWSFVKFYVLWG